MTEEQRKERNEYARFYMKNVVKMRKSMGLCIRCGKVPAREGKTYCQPCAEKSSKKALEYYYRKKGETE